MLRTMRLAGVLGTAVLGLACSGSISPERGSGSEPGGGKTDNGKPGVPNDTGLPPTTSKPPSNPEAGALNDSMTVPGTAPLRRLTKVEFANTIRDLLGVPADAAVSALSSDQDSQGSGFFRGGSVSTASDARAFMMGAEQVGTLVQQKLAGLLPCSPIPTAADAQDKCANDFIDKFGLRAFRRPLSADETNNLRDLYKAQRTAGVSFEESMSGLVTGVLQAPQFLYRWELGPTLPKKDGALVRYNDWEMASRLSYFFWGSMPDDKLFASAAAGGLTSPDQIAAEARRMLADDKAKDAVKDFFFQWLELGDVSQLEKDPMLTAFTPALANSMMDETRAFVTNLFFGDKADGKLSTLLTSTNETVDAGLAKLYGTQAGTVSMDKTQRSGIFTQASFLTVNADAQDSHPVHRGDAVLRRLLCTELVVPATLVVPPLPDPIPGQTTRERFSAHSANPCATCHKILDPVGFTFENYDAIGAWRTMDRGKPVDSTGGVALASGQINAKNAVDLMTQIQGSDEAKSCMTNQFVRYMLRRREIASEAPSVQAALKAFTDSGNDMRELMVALTRTKTFTHRALSTGEVSQ